jgi:hypothetical protein
MHGSTSREVTSIRLRKCSMKLEEIIAAGEAHCDAGFIIGILGLTFAALGVISDALNIIIVIESISWLLLSIVACLVAISVWMSWILAALLKGFKAESKNR